MNSPLTYQYTINPEDDTTTAGRILRLVGRDKQVLELGCAVGSMTSVLVGSKGCTVTGVEIDSAAAELARPYLSRLIIGDLDTLSWDENFAADRFDVILAADVLEHLRDPWRCLRNVAQHLRLGTGLLVASLPNIGHMSILAGLSRGEFNYSTTGLLDRTHIRFFTPRGVAAMLGECGLRIEASEFVQAGPEHAEVQAHWKQIGRLNRFTIERNRESRVYQSIFSCRPSDIASAEENIRLVSDALQHQLA